MRCLRDAAKTQSTYRWCQSSLTPVDGPGNDLMTALSLVRKCKRNQLIALHELADDAELHLRRRTAGSMHRLDDVHSKDDALNWVATRHLLLRVPES